MREAEFFARLAQRLGNRLPQAEPSLHVPGPPPFWRHHQLPLAERVRKFQHELQQLGGDCRIYASHAALGRGLAALIAELASSRIGVWGGEFTRLYPVAEWLPGYPIVTWDPQEGNSDRRAQWACVEVGLTGCDWAVADTGTLVLCSSPEQGRVTSLLPPVHVALVRISQLVTRLGEVLAALADRPQDMPAAVQFITGPSRSSDIEGDGTVGIHGPAAVYALLWDDTGEWPTPGGEEQA
ncbi:MAG: LUD domain-containing protein [Alicyclobacillus sp.]|nr:LUD domain-containing protein [Alicyclobacillus sp.]